MHQEPRPVILFGVTSDRSVNFHASLALSLTHADCDVNFVSSQGPNLEQLPEDIETHPIEMERDPSPFKDLKSLIKWVSLLKTKKPRLLMVGTPKASLLAMVAAKVTRVPIRVYFVHGLRLETAGGVSRALLWLAERFTLACATDVVAVSNSVRDRLSVLNLMAPEKVKVIGLGSANGINVERFRSTALKESSARQRLRLGLDPALPVIGFVGRMRAEKGLGELLEAAKLLKSKDVKFQLLLVGEPEDAVGKAIGDDLRKEEIFVVETGRVNDPEVYLQLMDLFCLPTYREGLVTVVLEAFAAEVPVVSTNVTGVVDLVKNMETGILVSPRNPVELADGIALLLKNPEVGNELSARALSFVRENFDSDKVVRSQMNYILSLMSDK